MVGCRGKGVGKVHQYSTKVKFLVIVNFEIQYLISEIKNKLLS